MICTCANYSQLAGFYLMLLLQKKKKKAISLTNVNMCQGVAFRSKHFPKKTFTRFDLCLYATSSMKRFFFNVKS